MKSTTPYIFHNAVYDITSLAGLKQVDNKDS